MPRRSSPHEPLPRRPDRRRVGGNATGAQRPIGRCRPGENERIAERRVRAFELRKAGTSYREIGRQLGIDVHTAHGDISAELAALREQTVDQAEELRALELERLDAMTAGLWSEVQSGSSPAVSAAVRVSERRSRLLGLDAPAVTKSELTGSLGVYAEQLAVERTQFLFLSLEQMAEVVADNEALIRKVRAMLEANARGTYTMTGLSSPPNAGVGDVASGALSAQAEGSDTGGALVRRESETAGCVIEHLAGAPMVE